MVPLIWSTTVFFAIMFVYYASVKWNRRKWPPGPLPHPIIGNAIEVLMTDAARPHVALHEMSKKYGSVFSCNLGVCPYVVVNGWKNVREVCLMDEFNVRFNFDWCLDRAWGDNSLGLIFSSFENWKGNRLYTAKTLRDVGFSKMQRMNALIQQEVQDMVQIMKRESGKDPNGVFHVADPFSPGFVNIVYGLLAGERFSLDDPKLHQLVKLSHDWFRSTNLGGSLLGAYPFLKDWIPETCGFGQLHRANIALLNYFTELVADFKRRGNYKDNPTNFIDAFLNRIESEGQNGSTASYGPHVFTERNLVCTLNDLFSAGSDTNSNAASFAVRTLVQRPDVQAKLQKEIDEVVGRDRPVSLEDRSKLPYTEAFVLEVIRRYTPVPIGPRGTTCSVKYGKYEIPKGTNVIVNLWSANMDPSFWGDPETFRPERWIDGETGKITGLEKVSAFNFGKRNCIGEVFARNALFVALSTFGQHFTFEVDPETGVPGDTNTKTLTVAPTPFNVIIRNRQ